MVSTHPEKTGKERGESKTQHEGARDSMGTEWRAGEAGKAGQGGRGIRGASRSTRLTYTV